MPHETTYERADELLDEARGYLPVDGAVPEPGHDPVAHAQVVATIGVGTAILALCDQLRLQHES
jgi:hypothetical protein